MNKQQVLLLRNQLVAIFSLILVLSIPACATVEGIGKDISEGARNVKGWLPGPGPELSSD